MDLSSITDSRWSLYIQAVIWRALMQLGMWIHRRPSPRPIPYSFTRKISSTLSKHRGDFLVKFYLPKDYRVRKESEGARFPVIVNFHGGGFVLGQAGDDARWATALTEQVGAVVADVDYRLAPEYPFPTAIEDGADAVAWIFNHADELHVDVDKISTSGFSAGGNMSITVPLMLRDRLGEVLGHDRYRDTDAADARPRAGADSGGARALKIATIVAFYPSTDYRLSREQRISSFVRKDQAIPGILTQLFDKSYFYPRSADRSSPYVSPAAADEGALRALPNEIIIITCEWDMLQAEAERFKEQLEKLGKRVIFTCVPSVPHGWDKRPDVFAVAPSVTNIYRSTCKELQRILK